MFSGNTSRSIFRTLVTIGAVIATTLIVIMPQSALAQAVTMTNPHTGEKITISMSAKDVSLAAMAARDGRLRILVIANGFAQSGMSRVVAKVEEFKHELLSLEPFNRAPYGSIEVEVRRASQDLGCQISGRSLRCNDFLVIIESLNAGDYDEIMVLDNKTQYGGAAWVDGGDYQNNPLATFAMVTLGVPVGVMIHEFGHSFGSLQDEYLYEGEDTGETPVLSVNCVANRDQLVGGYVQGCGRNGRYYRPAEESVMLTGALRIFNRVSIDSSSAPHGLKKRLEQFVGTLGEVPSQLPAPTNLRANVVGNQVTLEWDSNNNLSQLQVGFDHNFVNPAANFNVTGRSLSAEANSGTYFVRVIGLAGTQRSAPSNEVMVVVGGCGMPATPTGLRKSVSGNTVSISWNPSPGATQYGVSAWKGGAEIFDQIVGSNTSVQAPGVSPGTYNVYVMARNACGGSTQSATIEVVVP